VIISTCRAGTSLQGAYIEHGVVSLVSYARFGSIELPGTVASIECGRDYLLLRLIYTIAKWQEVGTRFLWWQAACVMPQFRYLAVGDIALCINMTFIDYFDTLLRHRWLHARLSRQLTHRWRRLRTHRQLAAAQGHFDSQFVCICI